MKRFKLHSTVFAAFLLIGVACKKDKEAPTITIKGDNPASVIKGNTYTDAGATAVDGKGNSITVDTDESDVNTNLAGSYDVVYAATNDNGTTTAKRTVNVVFNTASYVQAWDVSTDCGNSFPVNSTQNPTNTGSGLEFTDFFSLLGISEGTANATISGSTITFPQDTLSTTPGDVIFNGSGSMNSAGDEITVTFNYDTSGWLFGGGTGTCTGTFTLP